jgi:hypothetical protein
VETQRGLQVAAVAVACHLDETPGTNIDPATGGVVTSTISAPRNVQLGLKVAF